jgi:hypothetical protein
MKNQYNNRVNPAFLKYPFYAIINIVDIFFINANTSTGDSWFDHCRCRRC